MPYWLAGNWFHHTDPELSGRYYVGDDAQIYDAAGNWTGYGLQKQDDATFISGPAGEFSIDEHGNVSGDPFADIGQPQATNP